MRAFNTFIPRTFVLPLNIFDFEKNLHRQKIAVIVQQTSIYFSHRFTVVDLPPAPTLCFVLKGFQLIG